MVLLNKIQLKMLKSLNFLINKFNLKFYLKYNDFRKIATNYYYFLEQIKKPTILS